MNKAFRVKKSQEIEGIIKLRKSVGNRYFAIYKKENFETIHFRFAISIGRKYGIAVKRNKIKRQIREIIRMEKNNFANCDYLIIVKKEAAKLSFAEIEKQLKVLLKNLAGVKNE